MKEPDIYFDDSELKLSFDDGDWYGSTEESEMSRFAKVSEPIDNAGIHSESGKFGLGFSNRKNLSSSKDTNALLERLQRLKKKKKELECGSEAANVHAIVDDIDALSRTSLLLGLKKSDKSNQKIFVKDNIVVIKRKPAEVGSSCDTKTTKFLPTEQVKNVEIDSSRVMLSGDVDPLSVVKRKKKRSKQKNIRKDNRPNELKPEHLRPGDSFCGRPLTEETKRCLQSQRIKSLSAPSAQSKPTSNPDFPIEKVGNKRARSDKKSHCDVPAKNGSSNGTQSKQPRPPMYKNTLKSNQSSTAEDISIHVDWNLDYSSALPS